MSFLAELRRRNVVRMAGLYLVGAWLIVQVAETVLPAFDVPGWVLRATIICGAANNQLAHAGIEKKIEERGILYAPDYCVNAGGLIQVADELHPAGFSFERARQRATGIFDTTLAILAHAEAEHVSPALAADRIAEARMRDVGRLRSIWVG